MTVNLSAAGIATGPSSKKHQRLARSELEKKIEISGTNPPPLALNPCESPF